MKRIVMAGIISATMYAAAAALSASCTWMQDPIETQQGTGDEPEIPLDNVLRVAELMGGHFAGDTVWVRGFIVGGLAADGTVDFGCTSGDLLTTAVVLADKKDCAEPDSCLVLHLTKKVHKEALGLTLGDNKERLLLQRICAQGKVATHKGFPALTNLCQYQLE